jgi:hypothetical protein
MATSLSVDALRDRDMRSSRVRNQRKTADPDIESPKKEKRKRAPRLGRTKVLLEMENED